jgi:hypothetical protein
MQINIPNDQWAATPESIRGLVMQLIQQLDFSLKHNAQLNEGVHYTQNIMPMLAKIARGRPREKRQVVFICDSPASRQAKLAFGLKEIGWNVILLHKEQPSFDASLYFSARYQYSSPLQACLLACSFSPTAFHTFGSWACGTAKAVIEVKPGPLVFDAYDMISVSLQDRVARQFASGQADERFCLENADGVCTRHVFLSHAKRKLGFKPRKVVFFPEYCWDSPDLYGKPRPKKLSDGIHCAYVGSLSPEQFDTPEGRVSVTDRQFIRSLTDRKIHYHIHPYVGPTSPEQFRRDFAAYIEEADVNPYFHFYPMMTYEELHPILSQYHFGLVSAAQSVLENGDYSYKPIMHRRGTLNKGFDYIDADLVMITYAWEVPARLARGACMIIERSQIAEKISHITPEMFERELRDAITPVRRRLAVWRHSARLARFYENLMEMPTHSP